MIGSNPLVTLLAQYCPSPVNEAVFDESVQLAVDRLGLTPLDIKLPLLAKVMELLESDEPDSIVLTGTAGDGKTHICRKVFQQLRSHRDQEWGGCVVTTRLPSGYRLRIVKDFTELGDREQTRILAQLAKSLFDKENKRDVVFLIAANEGILTRKTSWNELKKYSDEISNQKCERQWLELLHNELTNLLLEGKTRSEQGPLSLFDLTTFSSAQNLGEVLKAVLSHDAWTSCAECALSAPTHGRPCPVYTNRQRLHQPQVQKRLQDLVELCEFNQEHLTMRHLLMLVANAIVGNSDITGPVPAISACSQVPMILNQDPINGAYFQNIFGANLSRGAKVRPFSVLAELGVGRETSSRIDTLLVYGDLDTSLADDYQAMVACDSYYGETSAFVAFRERYREDEPGYADHGFLNQLVAQRRRLYFEMPDQFVQPYHHNALTVYRYSHEYRESIVRVLERHQRVQRKYIEKLVCGLNRVFVGALLEESGCLLLSTSGTTSQARISDVLVYCLSNDPLRQSGMFLEWDPNLKVPILVIKYDRYRELAKCELTLARYEFLCRVGEGSLPSSFAAELYEDMLAFKAQLIRSFVDVIPPDELASLPLQLLSLQPDGRVSVTTVELLEG